MFQVMKATVLAFGLLARTTLAEGGEQSISTGAYDFKFKGSSGKFDIVPKAEDDIRDPVSVSQSKLEEICNGGKDCFKLNVAGQNSWTDPKTTETEDGATIQTTTFETPGNGKNNKARFSLTAYVFSDTVTFDAPVLCGNCSNEMAEVLPYCQAENNTCLGYDNTTGNCSDENYPACTEKRKRAKDSIEFDLSLCYVKVQDTSNTITYSITMESKGTDGENSFFEESDDASIVELNYAKLQNAPKGRCVGQGIDKEYDVKISTDITSDDSVTVTFEFPAACFSTEDNDHCIYYDPIASMTEGGNDATSIGASLAMSFIVSIVTMVLLF